MIFPLFAFLSRLVKMMSPNLNVVMLVGALLLYLSNVSYGMAAFLDASDASSRLPRLVGCRLWAWALPTAFTLLFGALFAKSWRVHRIFSNPCRTNTVIKDNQLLAIVGALLAVDVVVLVVWQVLDPITASSGGHRRVVDALTQVRNE